MVVRLDLPSLSAVLVGEAGSGGGGGGGGGASMSSGVGGEGDGGLSDADESDSSAQVNCRRIRSVRAHTPQSITPRAPRASPSEASPARPCSALTSAHDSHKVCGRSAARWLPKQSDNTQATMSAENELNGRVALITGASGGCVVASLSSSLVFPLLTCMQNRRCLCSQTGSLRSRSGAHVLGQQDGH